MTRHSGNRIAKGLGAEVIFSGDGGPVIVSGGTAMRLCLVAEEGEAAIVLSGKDGKTTIAEGTPLEMARTYNEMHSELVNPRQRIDWKSLAFGVFAATVVFVVFPPDMASRQSYVPASTPAAGQPAVQVPNLLPALEAIKERVEAAGNTQPPASDSSKAPEGGYDAGPAAIPAAPAAPILDRPDFLNVPEVLPDIPVPGTNATEASSMVGEGIGLPPYSPESPDVQASPLPGATSSSAVSPEEGEAATASPTTAADEPPVPPASTAKAVEPGAPAAIVDSGAASRTKTNETAKAEGKTSENIADQARETARDLVARGMTPDKALDVLKQLEILGEADLTQITPEMLAKLPHEIAHMLVEKGLAGGETGMLDAPDGVQYSIIRLPESAMGKYRGKDGIANIPERNTWASTGNFVSIPLPGGGDVKQPGDLLEFGLKP